MTQALGDAPEIAWLEPCHGHGAFLRAIADLGTPASRITALDIDPTKHRNDGLAISKRGIDFLQWAGNTRQRFDRVIGNPPYLSIKRLPEKLRESAANVLDLDGKAIGRASNTWYAFVLAALRLLRPDGSIAFVLPSAAEYADYSSAIRSAVRDSFATLEVFRCRRPLFGNVQEGTVVAIGRGYQSGPCRVRRREFDDKEQLISSLIPRASKNGRQCPRSGARSKSSGIRFAEVADVRLGGVTGDAQYFLLTESRRRELGIPHAALTPVVSRARHVGAATIDSTTWNSLLDANERVWLFNPDDQSMLDRNVRKYIQLKEHLGGCRRSGFKISTRDPWYQTPLPIEPHGFLSGMSRYGPWICMNEMSGLNATNTLYVVTFKAAIEKHMRYGWALALLSSPAQRQIRRAARVYADGLVKYEPGIFSRLQLPMLPSGSGYQNVYESVIQLLLIRDTGRARDLADSAIGTS